MDQRRLMMGLGLLLAVVGLVLVLATPGGFMNPVATGQTNLTTPVFDFTVESGERKVQLLNPGPAVGLILLVVGSLLAVVGFAKKA